MGVMPKAEAICSPSPISLILYKFKNKIRCNWIVVEIYSGVKLSLSSWSLCYPHYSLFLLREALLMKGCLGLADKCNHSALRRQHGGYA
jgi:hypothetical protein